MGHSHYCSLRNRRNSLKHIAVRSYIFPCARIFLTICKSHKIPFCNVVHTVDLKKCRRHNFIAWPYISTSAAGKSSYCFLGPTVSFMHIVMQIPKQTYFWSLLLTSQPVCLAAHFFLCSAKIWHLLYLSRSAVLYVNKLESRNFCLAWQMFRSFHFWIMIHTFFEQTSFFILGHKCILLLLPPFNFLLAGRKRRAHFVFMRSLILRLSCRSIVIVCKPGGRVFPVY